MAAQTISVSLRYCSFYVAGNTEFLTIFYEVEYLSHMGDYIFVSGLPWNEGETRITLGWINELKVPPKAPDLDGWIDTPNGYVEVSDAVYPSILKMEVPDRVTRIRIWTSHDRTPEWVIIALG